MKNPSLSIESQVNKYFKTFAWYDLPPGGGISILTAVEIATGVINAAVTAHQKPALQFMKENGWIELPNSRLIVITKDGFIETQRRFPNEDKF